MFMNYIEMDVMNSLKSEPYVNQRYLAELTGYSLGAVNKALNNLTKKNYINDARCLTSKALEVFQKYAPQRAIILAAGFGMRMVPINTEIPKALLEVNGEPLIERIIKQLHEVEIREIYVVVGFKKEQFEYLIDKYNIELIVNPEYSSKNNLYSLKRAIEHLSNCYIVPCDIWCNKNPFSKYELYSWYMVSDSYDDGSRLSVNRKKELVLVSESMGGNTMIGISYLLEEDANIVKYRINELCSSSKNDNTIWEEAMYKNGRMIVLAKVVCGAEIVDINTYEQLREIDVHSNHLKSDAIEVIGNVLNVNSKDIVEITLLKKGMTNRSFLFTCNSKKYIMRIPGEGTEKLINRRWEAEVYDRISEKHICEDIIYLNPENGYKITEFFSKARVCDPLNIDDVKQCMLKLREFHRLELAVEHEFDIFAQIEFYEQLRDGRLSVYKDYQETKMKVFSLKPYIDKHVSKKCLTHIDAVPDNFLFTEKGIRLIDWEYAGMQDPHVDVAMFCIYSRYNKGQIDQLIDIYFKECCPKATRIKIYCYISVCGLLWSNWCEYKSTLGVEFGEYSLRQYRYAKEYYSFATKEIKKMGENECFM